METFSALLALCVGNSPVTDEFPTQRPVTRSFDVFFDLRVNKRLSKQSWGWWLETPSRSLWRHSNAIWTMSHMSLLLSFAVTLQDERRPETCQDNKPGLNFIAISMCKCFPFSYSQGNSVFRGIEVHIRFYFAPQMYTWLCIRMIMVLMRYHYFYWSP